MEFPSLLSGSVPFQMAQELLLEEIGSKHNHVNAFTLWLDLVPFLISVPNVDYFDFDIKNERLKL